MISAANWGIRMQVVAAVLLLLCADVALAAKTYVLVTGRRDPRIYAIDLDAAVKPENNNSANAIVATRRRR